MTDNKESQIHEKNKILGHSYYKLYEKCQEKRSKGETDFNSLLEEFNQLEEQRQSATSFVSTQTKVADVLEVLSEIAVDRARLLTDNAFKFSWEKLKVSMTTGGKFMRDDQRGVDWVKLGREIGTVYDPVPQFSTLLGPLEKARKQRKASSRAKKNDDDNGPLATAVVISTGAESENLDTTSMRLKTMIEHISSFQGEEFNLLKTLFDPKDSLQSVENIFDFAFLLKVIKK